MTKTEAMNRLAVKFALVKENVQNIHESIEGGTIEEAIRYAKQLAYSAGSLEKLLSEIQNSKEPSCVEAWATRVCLKRDAQ